MWYRLCDMGRMFLYDNGNVIDDGCKTKDECLYYGV